ncbi:hypothetical protein KAF25_000630 [Fusarium avenaceum]|uniref:Uncharacterized protein n=1 Tax=Fusarium avenaceum TaxID=40199 RepID=A0A9P7KR29_9HYPO|nr:hypothetical protein KAF25_000630 [Fusarium avenaceum]
MINTLWKSPAELDHQLPGRRKSHDSVMSRLGGKNVVVFCSARVWRGAPKIILQIAAIFFTSFLIFGVLPDRLSGGRLGIGHVGIFPWGKPQTEPESNLRIVVFGSPDIVGNVRDPTSKRKTWTEELCVELNCTSYLSFIPENQRKRGLISNDLYDTEIEALVNITDQTNVTERPALDFDYIAQQYPTPSEVPDLPSQVKSFLAMPPPEKTPRETLWIFNFGTWEIWNMAAMPRTDSEDTITSMVRLILDQAEVLYERSLDPSSIAYSDFWTNATESQISELTAPGALDKIDKRKLESFRILAPMLFDISLTPGWQGRTKPPAPNSVVEQTRNAAELTKYWNQEIDFAIAEWKERTTTKPKMPVSDKTEASDKSKRTETDELIEHGEDKKESPAEAAADEVERVIQAPYPMRNGLGIDIGKVVLDAMTEGAMQDAAVVDLRGRGTLDRNNSMRFVDVWTPCVKGETADLAINEDDITSECEVEDDHLFYDSFTVSERAMKGVVKEILKEIKEELFSPKERRGWLYSGW